MRGSQISSWHIVRWHSSHFSILQGNVHRSDQFIDVRSHLARIWVIFKFSQPRSLEVSIFLALDTEQAVLRDLQTQQLDHPLELYEQVPLHVLKVDHTDVLPIIQPVQCVGRPPRSVVLHKLGPLCREPKNTGVNHKIKKVSLQQQQQIYFMSIKVISRFDFSLKFQFYQIDHERKQKSPKKSMRRK